MPESNNIYLEMSTPPTNAKLHISFGNTALVIFFPGYILLKHPPPTHFGTFPPSTHMSSSFRGRMRSTEFKSPDGKGAGAYNLKNIILL